LLIYWAVGDVLMVRISREDNFIKIVDLESGNIIDIDFSYLANICISFNSDIKDYFFNDNYDAKTNIQLMIDAIDDKELFIVLSKYLKLGKLYSWTDTHTINIMRRANEIILEFENNPDAFSGSIDLSQSIPEDHSVFSLLLMALINYINCQDRKLVYNKKEA